MIAPLLQYIAWNYSGTPSAAAIRREIRALLAVARAAKRLDWYDGESYLAVHRALARLEKVSNGGK